MWITMNDGEIWEMETMAAEAADLPRTRPSGLYPFHPPGLVLWLQQYPLDCSIIWQSLRGCTSPPLPCHLQVAAVPTSPHLPG